MESINISQLLQQVNHSYGNMCWVLRTTNREANTFSINSRWLLDQCVHDMTPKQLVIQCITITADTRAHRLLQQTFPTSTKMRESEQSGMIKTNVILRLLYQAILLFLHGSYLFFSNQTCWS